MTGVIRLGTRGSTLARWQTDYVRTLLEEAEPALRFETLVISTTGDRVVDKPLPLIGGKGLFTEELEKALRAGSIDLAVHSLKDLPTEAPADLTLGAIVARADPGDALVSREGFTISTLPTMSRVGTGSTRRKAQLLAYRPDLQIVDLRGNADTRLRKARDLEGPYDAIVIARAALERLDEMGAASELIREEIMLPAPGQGALAVECRSDYELLHVLRAVNHAATELETRAERSFLAALGGGCSVPVAARGTARATGTLRLRGRVCSPDGALQVDVAGEVEIAENAAALAKAEELGKALAAEALAKGAEQLLQGVHPRNGGLEP